MDFNDGLLVSGWIGLHVAGLLVAWATRVTADARWLGTVAQVLFFVLLAGLGGVAWWSHQLELGLWVPTGFTMGGMILLAVTDLQSDAPPHRRIRMTSIDGLY